MPDGNNIEEILKALLEHLKNEMEAEGVDITANWDEVRAYAAERVNHLATIVGQPGYAEAVIAERDSVALKAGIAAVDVADETDSRWLGLIQGALIALAQALAMGLNTPT